MDKKNTLKHFFFSIFILSFSFSIFLILLLPQTSNYSFHRDDFVFFELAQKVFYEPFAGFYPENIEFRCHPLFIYFLFLEHCVWKGKIVGYFLVNFLLHFFNAILVVQLARVLRVDFPASLIAGLVFLCSASFYGVVTKLTGLATILCLFFFLLATITWVKLLRGDLKLYFTVVLFQIAALSAFEMAIVFPLVAFCLTIFLVTDPEKRKLILLWFVIPLFLFVGIAFFLISKHFFFSTGFYAKISSPFGFIPKLFSLLRMLIFPLLTWDKGLLPFGFFDLKIVRLFPIVFFIVLFIFFLQKKGWRFFVEEPTQPVVFVLLAWIGITVLPYVAQSLTFEHATRCLYFPMVGFSIIFGIAIAPFFKKNHGCIIGSYLFSLFFLFYLFTLNIFSTSYHYKRYKKYFTEHAREDYTSQVHALFNEPRK